MKGIIGAIAGDVIGSAYEFNPTRDYDFELFTRNSTFTDDTVLTMANAQWLLEDEQHTHEKLVGMMRRSSPSLRQTEVLGVERPDWVPPVEWLDIPDVCRLLRISRKTLWKWTKKGILNAAKVEGRTYYDRADIDRMIRDNAIEENGRLDKTVLYS
jgi:predicted DNA-binding transcriptional regulator AlpA